MKTDKISGKTGNILVIIFLLLSGLVTLNFLPDSIAFHASGIAFLIAAVYGVVAVARGSDFLFTKN